MAIIPLQTARVSNYLRTSLSLSTITSSQRKLLEVENQISTGVRLNAPSDDPGNAQIAIALQRTLERRQAYSDNLTNAESRLSLVDSTLGDVTSILQEVQSLASANVGSDVTEEQRQSAAAVVRSLYSQLLTLANRQTGNLYLFGGDKSTSQPYVDSGGGVKFVGSSGTLKNVVDEGTEIPITVDGTRIFGGTSTYVQGASLSPNAIGSSRLSDLNGAQNQGIRPGSILISDGTQSRQIDLTSANTLDDVVSAINASGIATASITNGAITLSGSPTQTLSVAEVGGNQTARDLGLFTAAPNPAGVPISGQNLSARVTNITPISSLLSGTGLNLTSGITIFNGVTTTNVDFTGATTVEDIINRINGSGSGALARINADGTGIDVVNPTQGTALTVTDNGGTLASQLGIRSLSGSTSLKALNNGRGVQLATGADIRVTAKDGTTYDVDLNSASTLQDVVSLINTATGGTVTASFSNTGNGILLTDSTGGTGSLSITSLNFTTAAQDLGFTTSTTGTTLQAADTNPVRSTGVFDSLLRLAAAFENNDSNEITSAAEALQSDLDRVVRVRGENGALVKEVENRKDSLEDQNLVTQSLLSEIIDTDYTSAIAKYQLLQTTLEASYRTTSTISQLSLMDYLR